MSQARQAYGEARKAAIRLHKLQFYLRSNNMLKMEKEIHPIEDKEYETAKVPKEFADHREWNYVINLLKFNRYNTLTELYGISPKLGERMLTKINDIRGVSKAGKDMPITSENVMSHMGHHLKLMKAEESGLDKARIDRLLKTVDETRMGLLNSMALYLHYS